MNGIKRTIEIMETLPQVKNPQAEAAITAMVSALVLVERAEAEGLKPSEYLKQAIETMAAIG